MIENHVRIWAVAAAIAIAGFSVSIPLDTASAQGATCGTFVPAATIANPAQGTATVATSTACGFGANASGLDNPTAVGSTATASGRSSTAIGSGGVASRDVIAAGGFSTAVGSGSQVAAGATGGTAIGDFNTITGAGLFGTAIGAFNTVSAANGLAIGNGSTTSAVNGVAIGTAALSSGENAVALGTGARANADFASALGSLADATGANATAVGANSSATAANSTAIGAGATATFANSTAVGTGATATRPNQVVVGTATNTYTMPGIASAASLAAQSGPTSFVTSDAAGNLAVANINLPDISGLQNNVAILQGNVATLQSQMRQSFEGTAMAIAMGGSSLPGDKRFAISTNWGTFRGENAAAVLAQARITDYVVLNGGVAMGFAQGGVGGRAGVTFAW